MADDAPAPTYQPARIDESQLSVGRLVECTIIGKVDPKGPKGKAAGYEVEIGASQRAFVPRTHVALRPNATSSTGSVIGKGWAELPIGSVLEGQVLAMDGVKVNVSIARRQTTLAWQRVSQLADLDVTIDATVLRLSDAGAALDVEGLSAVLPWSHWGVAPEDRSWRLHGTRLPVKFLEVHARQRTRCSRVAHPRCRLVVHPRCRHATTMAYRDVACTPPRPAVTAVRHLRVRADAGGPQQEAPGRVEPARAARVGDGAARARRRRRWYRQVAPDVRRRRDA
jgi:ribosomal protein S1